MRQILYLIAGAFIAYLLISLVSGQEQGGAGGGGEETYTVEVLVTGD